MVKKVKQGLLAMVCIFTVMSAEISAAASETAGETPDRKDASVLTSETVYLEGVYPVGTSLGSARVTGSCGCTMQIETVSMRSCVRNNDKTHTSEYYVTYRCPHNNFGRTEIVQETHSYGRYFDKGHEVDYIDEKDNAHYNTTHIYERSCLCGDTDQVKLQCFASPGNSGGHAVP